ncbi:MAG: hypothetical protein R3B72_48300 [Polyangiaceae bacterium]
MTHTNDIKRGFFAMACALLVACGGADPESGAGGAGGDAAGGQGAGNDPLAALPACVPDGQTEPPHMDVAGAVYSVPVPVELEAYASYPIGDVSLCRTGNQLEMGYSLPALLVGKKTRVSFAGTVEPTSTAYALSSTDGTADCQRSGAAWTCTEQFTGLVVDLTEVAKEAEGLTAAEAQARLDVSTIFQGDPIGILDFQLP